MAPLKKKICEPPPKGKKKLKPPPLPKKKNKFGPAPKKISNTKKKVFLTPSNRFFGPPPIIFQTDKNKKTKKKHGIGTTIRMGQKIHCLPYAEFYIRLTSGDNYLLCITGTVKHNQTRKKHFSC